MGRNTMSLEEWGMVLSVFAFLTAIGLEVLRFCKRDVDGRGGWSALSVTFGDSSPRGRAKGARVCCKKMGNGGCRCLTSTYMGVGRALSVTFGDSSPRGRAKGEVAAARVCCKKIGDGARLHRYALLTVSRAPR